MILILIITITITLFLLFIRISNKAQTSKRTSKINQNISRNNHDHHRKLLFGGTPNSFGQNSGFIQYENRELAEATITDYYNSHSLDGILVRTPDVLHYKGFSEFYNTPLIPNFIFNIGSITKTFIATAILILFDRDLIDLNQLVAPFATERDIDIGPGITISMLLNMTSGIEDFVGNPEWETIWKKNLSRRWTIKGLLKYVKYSDVGVWRYSNANYLFLGIVIELITKLPLKAALHQLIFFPLNMRNTSYIDDPMDVPFYTHGHEYYRKNGKFKEHDTTFWSISWGWGAADISSNLDDMAIWANSFGTANLLSQNTRDMIFNNKILVDGTNVDNKIFYSNGFFITNQYIYHAGYIPGYCSIVSYDMEKGSHFVCLINKTDEEINTNYAELLWKILFIRAP